MVLFHFYMRLMPTPRPKRIGLLGLWKLAKAFKLPPITMAYHFLLLKTYGTNFKKVAQLILNLALGDL